MQIPKPSRVFQSLLRTGLLSAGLLAGTAALAAPPPGCDLHWQLSPQREATPPQVLVTLTLDVGYRNRTELQLPEGSEIALLGNDSAPNLDAVPGRPASRSVAHKPGERLTLRFAVMPGPNAWLRLAPGSLIFAAPALLPLPAETAGGRASTAMCISVDGLAETDQLLANQGQANPGANAGEKVLRLQGPQALARDWVVAAGALQQAERRAEGQTLRAVMAATTPMAFSAEALADAAARQAGQVRRLWADGDAPDQWLMLLPAPADAAPRGLATRQALLLQTPAALALPGREIDSLLLQTALQGWFRERFGPVAYDTRPDDPMNQWFTQGFASFYALRLQGANMQPGLQGANTQPGRQGAVTLPSLNFQPAPNGPQSLAAHAEALTAQLRLGGTQATAAPWLAMRWHTALREQGQPGLDAVLKRQLVPAALARPTGPLSSPLATHKLQASLRHVLAEAPQRDLQQFTATRSGPATLTPQMLGPETLGPCFRLDTSAQQVLPASDGEPTAACQAWLNGTPPLVATAARQSAQDSGSSTAAAKGRSKAGKGKASAKGKAGKSGKSSKGKAAASKGGGKSSSKGKRARH